ncbi:hypothetical protein ABW20_dc0101834 [Dactylellina cionopaga]|nr:hypothetical protein ABW20_dc0101834 [Dactylellina cionopaga]
MPPLLTWLVRRVSFNPEVAPSEFASQWRNPGDVFSVLLILGGDVVGRAIAQLAGAGITPVAFSFGENRLMPLPDSPGLVIHGHSGYARENSSWVIGRIIRNYDNWMDDGKEGGPIRTHLSNMIDARWEEEKRQAGPGVEVERPQRVGLCVSIYRAEKPAPGSPGYDYVYYLGFLTIAVQLAIAAVPCGLYGNWSILLVTACGTLLAFITSSLPQWSKEKWGCRKNSNSTVILTKGNGSQHVIVVIGDGKGLNLEDLASPPGVVYSTPPYTTRITIISLAFLWIILLICASAIKSHTWFLLAVGGAGMLQNTYAAGCTRPPKAFGVPLTFEAVFGELKVMRTLYAVENAYPCVGRSMRDLFFPGELRPDEKEEWHRLKVTAKDRLGEWKSMRKELMQSLGQE